MADQESNRVVWMGFAGHDDPEPQGGPARDRLPAGVAADSVARWAEHPETWPALLSLYESLAGERLRAPTSSMVAQAVVPRLRRAFEQGTLVAHTVRRPRAAAQPIKAEPPPNPPRKAPPKRIVEKTFIDVTVVDGTGRPLQGKRFKFQAPSGLLDQGLLPAGANFFQGNIDPGTGRIHFLPEEGDSHEPAESAPAEAAPPEATPNFEIHVVDELGEAVPSMGLKLRHGDRTSDVETDERGIVELEDHDATTVSIALADPAGAKDALRSRWNALRGGASVAASPMVTAVSLHGQTPEVDARARVPHTLSLRPYVARGRLLGGFFDTSKAFLLPGGVAGIRAIVALYDEHAEAELLVVGHTDSAGSSAYNDALSLERAESLIAYLKDDTSAWLRFYGDSVPEAKRWGRPEDEAMIGALPDFAERKAGESPVRWFRRTRGLGPPADRADRATRQKLVEEYMALDGTTLPAGVSATAHGAGEHFPAVDVGDGVAEAANRRVDIFFFDAELGIQPPPGGKNSKAGSREYPEWVARAQRTDDFFYGASRPLLIQLLDVSGDPLSGAEYEVSGGSSSWSGVTDSRGMVHVDQVPRDARCLLRWKLPPPPGEPPPKESDFDFERELFLEFEDADRDEAARRRLHNLGYDAEELEENVRDFQNDFGLEEKPWRDEPTWAELLRVHDELGTKKAS